MSLVEGDVKQLTLNLILMAQDVRSVWSTTCTYDLHKRLINQYILCRPGATSSLQRDMSHDKRDFDVIRENHQFLWDSEDNPGSWEARLAKKYYDKLFKEYAICDLSRYKENMVAMRWRTEKEVISGKGQFSCGEKKCSFTENLHTWEVNFGYLEKGEKKNALVKIRLCEVCSSKLNCHKNHREVIKKRKSHQQKHRKRSYERNDEDSVAEKKIKNETGESSQDSLSVAEEEENAIWKGSSEMPEDKSREEEFNEYLEDLFL